MEKAAGTVASVYLLELTDDDGLTSQEQAFASLDSAKAALGDGDAQWEPHPRDDHYWYLGDWRITRLEVQP